ncbi:MAG: hypothetical protein ACFCUG_09465 [Thiotrichales bacterium]
MSNATLSQTLQQLGNRYLSAYAQNAERAAAFWSGISSSGATGLTLDNLPKRYAEFVQQEGPRVMRQLAEANLNYYALVLNAGVDTLSRFYAQVLVPDKKLEQEPAPATAAQRARSALLFSAGPGETAINAFLVTNHRRETIDVRFEIGELLARDGHTRVTPEIHFTPAQCRIGPQSEQVVQCALSFPVEMPTGVDFRGKIIVAGFPELAMEITVRAEPARVDPVMPKDSTPPSPPTARKPRARAKRK